MPYIRCPSCKTMAYVGAGVGAARECPNCGESIRKVPQPTYEVLGLAEQPRRLSELRKLDDVAPQEPSAS